jgi:hypothetical protein
MFGFWRSLNDYGNMKIRYSKELKSIAAATDPVCHLSPQHDRVRSVLDRLPENQEDFIYRDRSVATKGDRL